MTTINKALIVTTIFPPNKVMAELEKGAVEHGYSFIIACDTKTPLPYMCGAASVLTIEQQIEFFPELAKLTPTKHYSRKNFGYLHAMSHGADVILETDDDNFPRESFFSNYSFTEELDLVDASSDWFNVYSLFSETGVWPRGFPLENILSEVSYKIKPWKGSPLIVQGLADENPDVDAVYRLTQKLPLNFNKRRPVALAPGVWCPFNSQNTSFYRAAFPLMYLPSNCSFRMTDIWRSFVAQRCLWEMGSAVLFTESTVYQERNEHNYLKDFEDEVPGYLNNAKIAHVLNSCSLTPNDIYSNVFLCYEALVREGIMPIDELGLVKCWLELCKKFQ
jgi:hypothetical protein